MSECVPLVDSDGKVIGNLTRSTGEKWYLLKDQIKWCHGCRKYLLHRLSMFVDSSGWYEPNLSWECLRCQKDRTGWPQCQ